MPTRQPSIAANPELLVDLVAANRILAMEGVLDGYGHVSARSDRNPAHFLMSRSLAPQLVKVTDIMEHGPDSDPVGDERKPYLERFLHGRGLRLPQPRAALQIGEQERERAGCRGRCGLLQIHAARPRLSGNARAARRTRTAQAPRRRG